MVILGHRAISCTWSPRELEYRLSSGPNPLDAEGAVVNRRMIAAEDRPNVGPTAVGPPGAIVACPADRPAVAKCFQRAFFNPLKIG